MEELLNSKLDVFSIDIIGVEGNDAPDDAIALTSSYHVDNDTTTPTSITSADYNQLSQVINSVCYMHLFQYWQWIHL